MAIKNAYFMNRAVIEFKHFVSIDQMRLPLCVCMHAYILYFIILFLNEATVTNCSQLMLTLQMAFNSCRSIANGEHIHRKCHIKKLSVCVDTCEVVALRSLFAQAHWSRGLCQT